MTKTWLQECLSSKNSLRIRKALHKGPKRKIELHRVLGLSRPTIDKYLSLLEDSNEVYNEEGLYYLSEKGLQELDRLEFIQRLSQLESLVDTSQIERGSRVKEIKISAKVVRSRFIKEVENLSGQNIHSCYICGKCSAGCPILFMMDIQPHKIIRLIQLGQEAEVLNSKTIWLCSSCFTCASRCPRGINLTSIMEALRLLVLRKGIDHISPSKIHPSILAEAPQLALVSSFRKMSG